jgi:hypothetical protein
MPRRGKITIAIQPFNGLTKNEIIPIEEFIKSIYDVETEVLPAVEDEKVVKNGNIRSASVICGHYLGGPSEEEYSDF